MLHPSEYRRRIQNLSTSTANYEYPEKLELVAQFASEE
jgi:hypothetical protein